MKKMAIGVDFGTLSARAVLCDIETGAVLCQTEYAYPHGVMDETFMGQTLPKDWALQSPLDYQEALIQTVSSLMKISKVDPKNVLIIGTDFTSCTLLPILKDGTPLCVLDKENPYAYAFLWKHHAAQKYADQMTQTALSSNEQWLEKYGGKISSEWMLPKVFMVYQEDRKTYEKADYFIEAGDYLTLLMTGKITHNVCAASLKGFYFDKTFMPSDAFLSALDKDFISVKEKLPQSISPLSTCAGHLTEEMAHKLCLTKNTMVSVSHVDAPVCLAAAGVQKEGDLLAVIGTSSCFLTVTNKIHEAKGICGVYKDAFLEGLYAYEAGQSGVGDILAYYVAHMCPAYIKEEAEKQHISVHTHLTNLAMQKQIGESRLLALDWLNGNRSVLSDAHLSGMILGLTLHTKPQDIYRALMESIVFGGKKIVDNYRSQNIPVTRFFASGGIPKKNAFMMQMYADVLNMEVIVLNNEQGPALSSAIFASVALTKEKGGYDDIFSAIEHMKIKEHIVYTPIKENVQAYQKLYSLYEQMHDYFGIDHKDIMHGLQNT